MKTEQEKTILFENGIKATISRDDYTVFISFNDAVKGMGLSKYDVKELQKALRWVLE